MFGYTGVYSFLANGSWDGALGPMAGLNDSTTVYGVTDTMTFFLSSPVYGIGGFLNHIPDAENSNPTTIAVYDASMTLLESYNLSFTTGGGLNTGQFYGFLFGAPSISYFTLTDNYVGIVDLTVQGAAPVPEPGTLLLLGAGLAGLAVRRRR